MVNYTYQSGGSLPLDSPSYVVRQADQMLFQSVLQGTYCYVLNARQMGKSSLRVRTVDRLLDEGIRCVEIELLGIGSQQITATQWYGGIIQILISRLKLSINRREWLRSHDDLSPVQRLGTFIEQVVLPQMQQPLVLFFDEIDSILGLNFPTEEFFGLIRNCYERRAHNPLYRQLTIVMLGVAAPSDLINDPQATPFNIGQGISLQGFTLLEAQSLLPGLTPFTDAHGILVEILAWTGGQPFLTQKLCRLVQDHGVILVGTPQQIVAEVVRSQILEHWETQDDPEHLRTICNRLLLNSTQPKQLLQLYQRLLTDGSIPINHSQLQSELRFSGLVTQHQQTLQVFNRIYSQVFNQAWIQQQIAGLGPPKSLSAPMALWQVPAIGLGSTVLALTLQVFGWLQPLELQLFDRLMGWRPIESADERFLLVTVSEADIQYQDQLGYSRRGSTLSDQALAKILEKLTPHHPRVIGVDFYQERPYTPDVLAHVEPLREQFIAVCEVGRTIDTDTPKSIAAPPNLGSQQIGFTDFAIDPDYRVRRQIIGMDNTEACPTNAAFSLRVALSYLAKEGITLSFKQSQQAQLGTLSLPRLGSTSGGYSLPKAELKGYQLLINYRQQHPPEISLVDLLRGNYDDQLAELIRDRIVLVGLTNNKDKHAVPGQRQRLSGVVVHAHMASQLISAVLNQRPLLWWWPLSLEILWIAVVSSAGSLLTRRCTNWSYLILAGGGIMVILGMGYSCLLIGGWIPIVSTSIAWLTSTGITTRTRQS